MSGSIFDPRFGGGDGTRQDRDSAIEAFVRPVIAPQRQTLVVIVASIRVGRSTRD